MRIIHITPAGGFGRIQQGGAERAVVELAEATAQLGHEVYVVAPKQFLEFCAPMPSVEKVPDPVSISTIPRIARLLRTVKPDVVVCHLLRGVIIGAAAKALGAPYAGFVSNLHNSLEQSFEDANTHNIRRATYRLLIQIIHSGKRCRTVAISPSNATDLVDHDHFPKGKIELIPDWVSSAFEPIDTSRKKEIRESLGLIDQETKMILFAGRLEQQKNPLLAVTVSAHLPCSSLLVVAGTGSLQTAMVARAAKLGVTMQMLDYVPDIQVYMGAADVLLVTSKFEGFGRVAVEGLAAGVPVVATPVAGLVDSLSPFAKPDVFFADPDNVTQWIEGVINAITSDSETLRRQRHEAALAAYGLDQSVDAYICLYQRVTSTVD